MYNPFQIIENRLDQLESILMQIKDSTVNQVLQKYIPIDVACKNYKTSRTTWYNWNAKLKDNNLPEILKKVEGKIFVDIQQFEETIKNKSFDKK